MKSVCAPLPLEIWMMIAQELFNSKKSKKPFHKFRRTPGLSALVRTNRAFYQTCPRFFYHRLHFKNRPEDATAFLLDLGNTGTPWTLAAGPRRHIHRSVCSVSFDQGDEMAAELVEPPHEYSDGLHQPLPINYTPCLRNLSNLIFLDSLTSLDLSNCTIPDDQFAALWVCSSPLPDNIVRLSLRGATISTATIGWFIGRAEKYWDDEDDWSDGESERELAELCTGDYSAWPFPSAHSDRCPMFASLTPHNCAYNSTRYDLPRLRSLDIATIYCTKDQIHYGILSELRFWTLDHLAVLGRTLEDSSEEEIAVLQGCISADVGSTEAPGSIELFSTHPVFSKLDLNPLPISQEEADWEERHYYGSDEYFLRGLQRLVIL